MQNPIENPHNCNYFVEAIRGQISPKWSQWDSNSIETEASDEKNKFVIS